MFKYTSKYCIFSMAGKNEILGNYQGYKKNKKCAVSYDENFHPDFEKVSYSYIYSKPQKIDYKLTQLVSNFNADFFKLPGKEFREIRETRNYYDKRVKVTSEYKQEDVTGLIDIWNKLSGEKYGWVMRSGKDREFFRRWYEQEQENLISRFYYIGEKLMGYAVLHRGEDNCYEYLIRKTDISVGRNTCLYIDYKVFEEIYGIENAEFFVNWGASSGKLLKYKSKFPIYQKIPVYFYTVKKQQEI